MTAPEPMVRANRKAAIRAARSHDAVLVFVLEMPPSGDLGHCDLEACTLEQGHHHAVAKATLAVLPMHTGTVLPPDVVADLLRTAADRALTHE